MKTPSISFLTYLFLCGCAAPPDVSTAEKAARYSQIQRDDLKKLTTIESHTYRSAGNGWHWFFFRGMIPDSGVPSFGIYLYTSAEAGHGQWDRAFDLDGERYVVQSVDVQIENDLRVTYHAFIPLPLEKIRAHQDSVWKIKVENTRSEIILEIKPEWIKGFLKSVDELKR